jgi:hypothetical protein
MAEREEEEKSRGFKVDDRRRFSAEGELKPEHQGTAQQEGEPQRSRPQPQGAPPHVAEGAPPRTSERGTAAMESAASSHPEINFATFVVSLSTQALMHLGEIPDPMTNQQQRDLPAAQHMIDILGMLQDKTRGNLDHDEEGMLRSILFDLRMKYVETARHNPGS